MSFVTIDILCRVVDNYGDIGVVYRLAKALSDTWVGADLDLRLHVDNLEAFRELCPQIDPSADRQSLRGRTVLRWNSEAEGRPTPPPRIILECFACGPSERLAESLLDAADPEPRVIVNIEHLTAESWADEFHLLAAATRSAFAKKWFFMPGFSEKTGGLIIDRGFREACEKWLDLRDEERRPQRLGITEELRRDVNNEKTENRGPSREKLAGARRELFGRLGLELPREEEEALWIPLFSYERNYSRVVGDLAAWGTTWGTELERKLEKGSGSTASKLVGKQPFALVAAGRSQACFFSAWEAASRPFPALALPFLSQENWDEILLASDFLIVRGEESLARAALAGRPFLWHAYLQEGGYQLVKVRALLERLRPFFSPADFALIETLWLSFNDRAAESATTGGNEPLLPFLRRLPALEPGYASFAAELSGHGDLAAHLVTFLREVVYNTRLD